MLNLNETLGSSKPAPLSCPRANWGLHSTRKETGHTTWALLKSVCRRPGATPTRKRNCPGINVFLLLAGNETKNRKQKLRSVSPPFAPHPGPVRAPRLARASSAFALIPRASCLALRAWSHVPAPAPARGRVGSWAALAWVWPADLPGAGLSRALRSARQLRAGLQSAQRTQAARGRGAGAHSR